MSTTSASGRQMGVPPLGGGNAEVGLGGVRSISTEDSEQGLSVHFDTTDYGTL